MGRFPWADQLCETRFGTVGLSKPRRLMRSDDLETKKLGGPDVATYRGGIRSRRPKGYGIPTFVITNRRGNMLGKLVYGKLLIDVLESSSRN